MTRSIEAGVVVRVDTAVLRAGGAAETNAQVTADEDRAVTGVQDFLVLQVTGGLATAIPLFPRSAPGSAPLDDRLRTGDAAWLARQAWYSRWQHWRVPVDALASAVVEEDGAAARGYAAGQPDVLQDLANWASRNRCAFRRIG